MHYLAEDVLFIAAGLVMVAIATVLLRVSRRDRAMLAFAILLVVRGLTNVAEVSLVHAEAPKLAINAIDTIAELLLPLAIVGFAIAYPPRPLARRAWPWVALAAVAVVVLGAYAIRPALYETYAYDAADGALSEVGVGPLGAFSPLQGFLYGVMALLFLREVTRAATPDGRRALTLVSLAFAMDIAYNAAGALVFDVTAAEYVSIWERFGGVSYEAALLPLAAAWALAFASRRTLPFAGVYLALVPLAAALGALTVVVDPTVLSGVTLDSALGGLLRLAFAGIVAYALLHARLFDIDLRLKTGIRRGSIAGAFLAVFIVVTQIAQNALSDSMGIVVGGATAGLLVFALHPLQRAAERIANIALPAVHDTDDYRASRKGDVYKGMLRAVLSDGVLTRQEERALADLADEMRLPAGVALRLREEVEQELGIVVSPGPSPAA